MCCPGKILKDVNTERMMMKTHAVITVDRSLLAANMYRLIFMPMGFSVVTARSLEELSASAKRVRGVDLLVVSSNAVAGHLMRFVRMLTEDVRFIRAAKIVLVGEKDKTKGMDIDLAKIGGLEVIEKPFHPDMFTTMVKRLLDIEE